MAWHQVARRLASGGPGGVGTGERARLAALQRAAARRAGGRNASPAAENLPLSLSLAKRPPPPAPGPPPGTAPDPSAVPPACSAPVPAGSGRELVLSPPALVVTREFELANILLGFEQANKYTIRAAPGGQVVGFIAESDGIGKSIVRNVLRTHRSFKATVFDKDGDAVFEIRRPAYLISTNMFIHEPGEGGAQIGHLEMAWHLWRRRYRLFCGGAQFAECDTGFLGVDFVMQAEDGRALARVNKDFTGFAREIFTDARQYVIRLDPSHNMTAESQVSIDPSTIAAGHDTTGATAQDLGLRERAVLLASAICIDFDYFSLHSRGPGGMFMPMPMPGGGGGAAGGAAGGAEGGAAGGAAGEVGGAGAVVGAEAASEAAMGGGGGEVGDSAFGAGGGGDSFGHSSSAAAQDGSAEWAQFEEPDLGFQDDPSVSDSGDAWGSDGGGGEGWGSGFGDGGLSDVGSGGEGGGAGSLLDLIKSIFWDSD